MLATAFSVSWVDFLIVILALVGVLRGRKRGMSEELLDIIKWTFIVVLAAMLYEPGGRLLAQLSMFNLLYSYVAAYAIVTMLVFSVFTYVKQRIGDKFTGTDKFGNAEYYLGMMAGGYRFLCIVLVSMAFLNARQYSQAEIAAADQYQDYNFGTKLIPTVPDLQKEVFKSSFTGRAVHDFLPVVLIRPTPRDQTAAGASSNRRNGAVDQILDKK